MNKVRWSRRGVAALLGTSSTVIVLASCVSGGADSGSVPPGFTGGAPAFGGGTALSGASGLGGSSASSGSAGGPLGSAGLTSMGGALPFGSGGAGASDVGASAGTSGSVTAGSFSNGGSAGEPTTTSGGSTGNPNCTDLPPNNGDTCQHAVEYGWCTQSWLGESCQRSCGKCNGGGGGSPGAGGSPSKGGGTGMGQGGMTTSQGGMTNSQGGMTNSQGGGGNVQEPPRLSSGTNGWASRYWDCCKPSCGWKGNTGGRTPTSSCDQQNQSLGGNYDAKNACESGGTAFMCWSGAPWSVSPTLSYGFAAVNGQACGRCFQVQFTGTGHDGNNPGAQSLSNKTMIVQAINVGGIQQNQFDLLIPGGGVGDFDACSRQWNTSSLGARYGGFGLECRNEKGCIKQKCDSVFAGKPELMAGCTWYLDWFNAADNPNFIYKQIACPQAIVQRSGLSDPG